MNLCYILIATIEVLKFTYSFTLNATVNAGIRFRHTQSSSHGYLWNAKEACSSIPGTCSTYWTLSSRNWSKKMTENIEKSPDSCFSKFSNSQVEDTIRCYNTNKSWITFSCLLYHARARIFCSNHKQADHNICRVYFIDVTSMFLWIKMAYILWIE